MDGREGPACFVRDIELFTRRLIVRTPILSVSKGLIPTTVLVAVPGGGGRERGGAAIAISGKVTTE